MVQWGILPAGFKGPYVGDEWQHYRSSARQAAEIKQGLAYPAAIRATRERKMYHLDDPADLSAHDLSRSATILGMWREQKLSDNGCLRLLPACLSRVVFELLCKGVDDPEEQALEYVLKLQSEK